MKEDIKIFGHKMGMDVLISASGKNSMITLWEDDYKLKIILPKDKLDKLGAFIQITDMDYLRRQENENNRE